MYRILRIDDDFPAFDFELEFELTPPLLEHGVDFEDCTCNRTQMRGFVTTYNSLPGGVFSGVATLDVQN